MTWFPGRDDYRPSVSLFLRASFDPAQPPLTTCKSTIRVPSFAHTIYAKIYMYRERESAMSKGIQTFAKLAHRSTNAERGKVRSRTYTFEYFIFIYIYMDCTICSYAYRNSTSHAPFSNKLLCMCLAAVATAQQHHQIQSAKAVLW